MNKIFSISLFFATVGFMAAQSVEITFIEDSLFKKTGSTYAELYIGDSLSVDQIVKINAATSAVLLIGSSEVRLKGPGEWKISDFVVKSNNLNTMGYSTFFGSKMTKLMGQGQDMQATTVMGLRGSEVDTPEAIAARDYFMTGLENLNAGDYSEAFDLFTDCLDYVRLEQLNEVFLHIAYAQAGLGEKNSALLTLESSPLETDSVYYSGYAVFRAGLLLDMLDFTSALDYIQTVDFSLFNAEDQAAVLLQKAFAFNGLGRSTEYKATITELKKKPYASTEAGKLAKGLK